MGRTVTISFTDPAGAAVNPPFAPGGEPTLASHGGTFGVRRMDTGATIVAHGTAMVQTGTGVWTYTLGALDPGAEITLQAAVRVTAGGQTTYLPITLAGSVDDATIDAIAAAVWAPGRRKAIDHCEEVEIALVSEETERVQGFASTALNQVWTNTSRTLTGGQAVTIVSPIDVNDDDRLNLIQGDAYTSASRRLSWEIADWTGPNLDGLTGKLRLLMATIYEKLGSNAQAVLEVDATFAQVGATVTVTAAVTSVQTAALNTFPPLPRDTHYYQLVVTAAGEIVTPKIGPVTVRRRIDPTA